MTRRHILSLILFLFVSLLCFESWAEPIGFRRARATFGLGLDVFDAMGGNFGRASDVGMSVFAEASLQVGGYFGGNIRFGSARAFTNKSYEALPFDYGYQFIYFVVSPRFNYAPLKLDLNFYVQPEIAMHVMVSNTLVGITGNKSLSGSAGGAIGAQFIIGIISVSGQVSCRYNWDYHSVFLGGSISIGVSSTI